MNILRKITQEFSQRRATAFKDKDIAYKIIDASKDGSFFLLQCINKKAVFYVSLEDLVYKKEFLLRLHPVQACYVGIEYARVIEKTDRFNKGIDIRPEIKQGVFYFEYQDRNGRICFTDTTTCTQFFMLLCDIVCKKDLIEKFNPIQAFHIGVLAGDHQRKSAKEQKLHLRIVT